VRVAGFSGSGFSRHASRCGDVSFATRAAAAGSDAGLVVVEGGLNDFDRTEEEIEAGFARLVAALAGRDVVVVGPASAPSRAQAVIRVDRLLARLTEAAGWRYVPAYGWELDYLPDGLHLTVVGHREFGDRVAEAVGPAA
jgi:acyl-CoA thioesterase-1